MAREPGGDTLGAALPFGEGPPSIQALAAMPSDAALDALGSRAGGLGADEAEARLATFGPNAIRTHHAGAWSVLVRQFKSALLLLLIAAAVVSAFVGQGTDAIIIAIIISASVGLGFVNEYRAERAAEALHSGIRHMVTTFRGGEPASLEVTHLVPGDVVHLDVGAIVPADLRLLAASGLECDESILTGESVPAVKSPAPVEAGAPLADLSSCLFMGTVVSEGSCDAVVAATGARTQFGLIAMGLGEHVCFGPPTAVSRSRRSWGVTRTRGPSMWPSRPAMRIRSSPRCGRLVRHHGKMARGRARGRDCSSPPTAAPPGSRS
jgi:Mg2+-importing ATPase